MRRASLSLGVRLIKTYLLLLSAHQQQTHDPFSGLVPQFEDTARYFSILFPLVNSAGFTVSTSMFKSLYFFMEISDSLWTLWVQITRYDRQYSACQSQQWDNPADVPVSLPAALDDMFPSSSTHTGVYLDWTHTHQLTHSPEPQMWINPPLETVQLLYLLYLDLNIFSRSKLNWRQKEKHLMNHSKSWLNELTLACLISIIFMIISVCEIIHLWQKLALRQLVNFQNNTYWEVEGIKLIYWSNTRSGPHFSPLTNTSEIKRRHVEV